MAIYVAPSVLSLAQTAAQSTGLLVDVVLTHWAVEEFINSDAWPNNNPAGITFGNPAVDELSLGKTSLGFLIFSTPAIGAQAYAVLINTDPNYSGIRQAITTNSALSELNAIIQSPWDNGHYNGGALLYTIYNELSGESLSAPYSPYSPPSTTTTTSGPVPIFRRSDALILGYIMAPYLIQAVAFSPSTGSNPGFSPTTTTSYGWGFDLGALFGPTLGDSYTGGTGAGGGLYGDIGKAAKYAIPPFTNLQSIIGQGGGYLNDASQPGAGDLYGFEGDSLGVFAGNFGIGGGYSYQEYVAQFGYSVTPPPISSGGGGGWFGGASGGNAGGGGGGSGYILDSTTVADYNYYTDSAGQQAPPAPPTQFYAIAGSEVSEIGVNQGAGYCIINETKFVYTGAVQTYTVPATGGVRIDCYGGQGGGDEGLLRTAGGLGGHSGATFNLDANTVLYIFVGNVGQDDTASSGFNGAGPGLNMCYGGGGATDVRWGLDPNYNNSEAWQDSLYYRFIVAGGGGGMPYYPALVSYLDTFLPPSFGGISPQAGSANVSGSSVSTSASPDYFLINDLSVASIGVMYSTSYTLPTSASLTVGLVVNGVTEATRSFALTAGSGVENLSIPFSDFLSDPTPAQWDQVYLTIQASSGVSYVQIPPHGLTLTISTTPRASDSALGEPKPVAAKTLASFSRDVIPIRDTYALNFISTQSFGASALVEQVSVSDISNLSSVVVPLAGSVIQEVVLVNDAIQLNFLNTTSNALSEVDQVAVEDKYFLDTLITSGDSSVPVSPDQVIVGDVSTLDSVAVSFSEDSSVDQVVINDTASVTSVTVTEVPESFVDQLVVDDKVTLSSYTPPPIAESATDQVAVADNATLTSLTVTELSDSPVDQVVVADNATLTSLTVTTEVESSADQVVVTDQATITL